jgi:hypothetical protein
MNSSFARKVSASVAAISVALACSSGAAISHAAAPATPTASTPPKTIALVSAVGDQFSFVRQKQSTGSHLEPFTRQTLKVPDQVLNHAVLRGLDRAMGAEYPESTRVFVALSPEAGMADVLPQEREAFVFKRVLALLEQMPERQTWDQIVLVTPKWLFSERAGMGSKLSGIGMYVQPLEGPAAGNDFDAGLADEVETPDKDIVRSKTYVAPFFYTTVTTLDAKTLTILKQESRHDFRKIFDPKATAVDVQNAIPPAQMAAMIERFVETAALRSMTSKPVGSVEIGPLKSTPAQTESAPKR